MNDVPFNHPEKLENEIYLGNYTYDTIHYCGWHSKRVGNTAYDIYGKIIHQDLWRNKLVPIFILKEEVLNKIKRLNNERLHTDSDLVQNKIKIYLEMLDTERLHTG